VGWGVVVGGGGGGGKRPRREVGHSPPSVAEVKNKWSCTSTPFMSSWLVHLHITLESPS